MSGIGKADDLFIIPAYRAAYARFVADGYKLLRKRRKIVTARPVAEFLPCNICGGAGLGANCAFCYMFNLKCPHEKGANNAKRK